MSIKTYSELITLPTFIDRYRYLKLERQVGKETFGFDRWLNQNFYHSDDEWRSVRDRVIIRDNGCDLAIPEREIRTKIFVHHMNPITKEDIIRRSKYLLDPEYLICMTKRTHDAIHYGNEDLLIEDFIERKMYDTCPWKHL